MWPFKHKHRVDYSLNKTKLSSSLVTGAPVQVSYQSFCKCGHQIRKELSPAGYQQLEWGADYESLFDDGPIRPAAGKEEAIKNMEKNWFESMGYTVNDS